MLEALRAPGLWLAFALLFIALAACDDTDRCKSKIDCEKLGKCTSDKNGLCVVGSSQDCKVSELCKLQGKCSAKDAKCVAASDADCKGSEACTKSASCNAYQGSCEDAAKSVHAECTKSCELDGLCVTQGDKCVALSRRHCAGTFEPKPEAESPCGRNGLCTAEGGRCVAASNEDCALGVACKEAAQCLAKDGQCVARGDDCKKSDACSKDGKCGVKDGRCAAVTSVDCRQSLRCKLEGSCSLKDGACIAASSADCQLSSNCTKVNRCTAEGGVCVGSGSRGGGSATKQAPDHVTSTTITSPLGH